MASQGRDRLVDVDSADAGDGDVAEENFVSRWARLWFHLLVDDVRFLRLQDPELWYTTREYLRR